MSWPRVSPGSNGSAVPIIVGASEGIARVKELVELAARGGENVLLLGETGSGKELVARAIYRAAGGEGPFVPHNCALTPADMFDSEFLGHVRGSFTGAHRSRIGLLRAAHGGILFLDELECLGLAHQAKLLRVLDDGQVRALGSERPTLVSVRFIAATNRAPDSLMAEGTLREDFYFRLSGFEIRIPPLRERLDDVPLLVEHFLWPSGKRASRATIDRLMRCSWPGNVRQLRSIVVRAAVNATGDLVEPNDLDLNVPGGLGASSIAPRPRWSLPAPGVDDLRLETVASETLLRVLTMHEGNRSRTARALGIHRSTLHRRLQKLGLSTSSRSRSDKIRGR